MPLEYKNSRTSKEGSAPSPRDNGVCVGGGAPRGHGSTVRWGCGQWGGVGMAVGICCPSCQNNAPHSILAKHLALLLTALEADSQGQGAAEPSPGEGGSLPGLQAAAWHCALTSPPPLMGHYGSRPRHRKRPQMPSPGGQNCNISIGGGVCTNTHSITKRDQFSFSRGA